MNIQFEQMDESPQEAAHIAAGEIETLLEYKHDIPKEKRLVLIKAWAILKEISK